MESVVVYNDNNMDMELPTGFLRDDQQMIYLHKIFFVVIFVLICRKRRMLLFVSSGDVISLYKPGFGRAV